MSKIIGTHNGIESDSVDSPVNFTTGLQINGTDVLPEADVIAIVDVQDAPSDVTTTAATADLTGSDTVDQAAAEAALADLKADVEALASAFNNLLDVLTTAGVLE